MNIREAAPPRSAPAIVVGLCLLMASAAHAEPPETMQSAEEAARSIPIGPWQGRWTIRREHPALTRLGTQQALSLTVFHDAAASTATLHWQAERALCEPPTGAPCEWLGASGEARGVVIGPAGLMALLPVAADGQLHALHLAPARLGRSQGLLLHPDAPGYAVAAERLHGIGH